MYSKVVIPCTMAAPQNNPAPPDELLSLQNEFRAISMLLTIVTAANHKGHSTLNPTHGKGPRPLRSLLNLRHQHRNTLILNAISALLVRDGRDVVSVVNRGSGDGHYCIMGNAYTKVVMDGDDDFDEESTKLLSAALECGFTTFTNAGPKDPHFKDTSDPRVRLAHPGKSHWSKISQLESREIFELDKLWQVIVICMTSLVDYTSATGSEKMTPWKTISSRQLTFSMFTARNKTPIQRSTSFGNFPLIFLWFAAIRHICELSIGHLEGLFIILQLSNSVYFGSSPRLINPP